METVRIVKVYKSDKKKDDTPLEFKGRDGKMRKAMKVAIKTDKHGDVWISCLAFNSDDPVLSLKEGDEKTLVIWENNGFLNFKLPTKLDMLESRIEAIENHLRMRETQTTSVGVNGEKIDPSDIPF